MGGVNCSEGARGAASPCHDPPIIVYTDGSAIRRNGLKNSCGWACKFIYKGQTLLKSGGKIGRTSNQMEIIAVREALRSIRDKSIPVILYTDSRYAADILNGRLMMYKNIGLWDEVLKEKDEFTYIRFVWVKGHDGNEHNEDVDKAASSEARKQLTRQKEWLKNKN